MNVKQTIWSNANYVGGEICLDFANTLSGRGSTKLVERLLNFEDLVSWSLAVGNIDKVVANQFLQSAAYTNKEVNEVQARGLELREAIFEILFSTRNTGKGNYSKLEIVNEVLSDTCILRRLKEENGQLMWDWQSDPSNLIALLGPVALSAAELFTGKELDRVKICHGNNCAWLFVDRTRNGSRKWCDMAVCGNRVKARRFYRATSSPS